MVIAAQIHVSEYGYFDKKDTYTGYRYVDFGSDGADSFTICVKTEGEGGRISIKTDPASDTAVSELEVPNTGGAWQEITADISSLTGSREIYICCDEMPAGGRLYFDYFTFNVNSGHKNLPTRYSVKFADNGSVTAASPNAGKYTIIFAAYKNGVLTSAKTADAEFVKAEEISITPPNGFVSENADTVQVMMWNTLDDMVPLCNADTK